MKEDGEEVTSSLHYW